MDADAVGTLVLRSPLPGRSGGSWSTNASASRAAGYRELTLWTQRQLEAARGIYVAAGFELVAEEQPTLQFGTLQVSETWRLLL